MADRPAPGTPMTGATVGRVLHRAVELSEGHDQGADGISPDVLVEAAAEVGIPAGAVRRAMVLEHLEAAPRRRRLDTMAGPVRLAVVREVPIDVDTALARLDVALVRGQHLRRGRRRPGVGEWRARAGWTGRVHRLVDRARGQHSLRGVEVIVGDALPVDEGSSMVRLIAVRARSRRRSLAAGGTVGMTGIVAGAVAAVTVAPVTVVLVPVGALAGVAVARRGRAAADAVDEGLEGVLDAVEDGTRIPSLLRRVVPHRVG